VCHKASGVDIDGTEECLTIKRVIARYNYAVFSIMTKSKCFTLVTFNIVVADLLFTVGLFYYGCLTSLLTISHHLFPGDQLYWWRKPEKIHGKYRI
jgi:hypothetical protein